eukprot:1602742-Prymnesium_polylepis.1
MGRLRAGRGGGAGAAAAAAGRDQSLQGGATAVPADVVGLGAAHHAPRLLEQLVRLERHVLRGVELLQQLVRPGADADAHQSGQVRPRPLPPRSCSPLWLVRSAFFRASPPFSLRARDGVVDPRCVARRRGSINKEELKALKAEAERAAAEARAR